ncbi:hypothetical protein DE146DRAFT_784945 [Phaeosphaeria sp. MPI-PUGE-AT-0046c]|nr:hypothetical protein DE146DRAFT_784945 [Phaeosphaeria sp. MPI-PUGE-AT-0046c]
MSQSPPTRTTIFIWPTGLFPRRIIYLLRAKSILLSDLAAQNIHLVPVQLTPTGLTSHPDYEQRPEGSLPVMRLDYTHPGAEGKEDETVFVRESMAILEYLDELFSSRQGHKELKGATALQRARCADILSALSDAVVWGTVSIAHSNPAACRWSGLDERDMSAKAAVHADTKVAQLMGKMDGWVRGNMAVAKGGSSMSLAGKGAGVTLADVALMAQVEYIREVYGMDCIVGYGGLEAWWEGMRGEEWVVGREVLVECEKMGKWEGVLGE